MGTIDTSCLQEVITAAAVCCSCKSHKGTLQLWQDNSKRKGLHETLLLRCMNCHKEFPCETGNRLGGKGGGGTKINVRLTQGGLWEMDQQTFESFVEL